MEGAMTEAVDEPTTQLLVAALEGWFGKPFHELPAQLRQLVAKNYLVSWDTLSPAQQRGVAMQVDYYHDPANDFEQDFWLTLVARKLQWTTNRREMATAPAADAVALAARNASLAQIDQELAGIAKDEAEVGSVEPSEQREAMERVLVRWRDRDPHAVKAVPHRRPGRNYNEPDDVLAREIIEGVKSGRFTGPFNGCLELAGQAKSKAAPYSKAQRLYKRVKLLSS
jgi:hypothetical protein